MVKNKLRAFGTLSILCFVLVYPLRANQTNSPDTEFRALLLSVDRVEAVATTAYDNGNTMGLGIDIFEKTLCDFPLERLRLCIENLELTTKRVILRWGSDTIPSLYFRFYKDKEPIAILYLDYGSLPNTILINPKKHTSYNLHPESAFALREIVARQPQFIKEVIKLGAKAQDMAPQRAYEINN